MNLIIPLLRISLPTKDTVDRILIVIEHFWINNILIKSINYRHQPQCKTSKNKNRKVLKPIRIWYDVKIAGNQRLV